jgi:hypothetical protein
MKSFLAKTVPVPFVLVRLQIFASILLLITTIIPERYAGFFVDIAIIVSLGVIVTQGFLDVWQTTYLKEPDSSFLPRSLGSEKERNNLDNTL